MKTLVMFLSMLWFGTALNAQHVTKTDSFKVSGNCDECKARIENAADIKGVKLCTWDKSTHMAKVIYNPEKVSVDKIKEAVAKAGHDVEGVPAPDGAYKKLPDCCKYRDGNSKMH